MAGVAEDIRRLAGELFQAGKIDLLIGFEQGTGSYRARPVFVESAAGAEGLTWDSTCSSNLAVYLPSLFRREPQKKGAERALPRVAVVAKACDMRSLVALIKEKQAPRENLFIIGIPCRGMVDERKLAAEMEKATGRVDVTDLSESEDSICATTPDGRKVEMAREPLVQDACRECRFPVPQGADATVAAPSRPPANGDDGAVLQFSRRADEERWKSFEEEISRCIRCYACRQACPTCYCTECFAETNRPAWIGATAEITDTMIFHIIRIFHQAGRCVECDACVRACPMGIDLRPFAGKIALDVREMFGFTPGFDLESPPPLITFKDDDRQDFITEPHRG
ncbi:MAG TPA: Coenzyme F420 hydrogenase/dehydrogenase, beta subunit C-terminal domain [Spirochaetia bacterium]|nr:Coenzyme F420 hydrogenase/dehydrogenase, beta subunit C-terminal domain [Spirochaetia bacterium]